MRAIVTNDHVSFADAVLRICETPENIDRDGFYASMRTYLDKYRIITMEEMSSTVEIFSDLYQIARSYGIRIPKSMTMFWRSI